MSQQREKSRYAQKRDRNEMMYGPGCCAHKVSFAQIAAAKQKAWEERQAEREQKQAKYIDNRENRRD